MPKTPHGWGVLVAFTIIIVGPLLAQCARYALAEPLQAGPIMSITQTADSITVLTYSPRSYSFEPKEDISAIELSKVLIAIMPALTCRNVIGNGCDPTNAIEALPENVKRHFVLHDPSRARSQPSECTTPECIASAEAVGKCGPYGQSCAVPVEDESKTGAHPYLSHGAGAPSGWKKSQ